MLYNEKEHIKITFTENHLFNKTKMPNITTNPISKIEKAKKKNPSPNKANITDFRVPQCVYNGPQDLHVSRLDL